MRPSHLSQDDLELAKLREEEQRLLQQQKEITELPKKLERERHERDRTMPPLESLKERERARKHEQALATRGGLRNLQKAQNRSILLLIMLVLATCSLVAWGIKLMNG